MNDTCSTPLVPNINDLLVREASEYRTLSIPKVSLIQRFFVRMGFCRLLEHEAWLEREKKAQDEFRRKREKEEKAQKEKEEREVV